MGDAAVGKPVLYPVGDGEQNLTNQAGASVNECYNYGKERLEAIGHENNVNCTTCYGLLPW